MNDTCCPVCESAAVVPFLRRDLVPVHQNLVVADADAARRVARGVLDMVVCRDCGFVFNRAFDASLLAYGHDYDNTQSCSPCFEAYLDGLVADMVERQGVRRSTVVEVGCGKGLFLKKLVAAPGADNRGVGFDPSYVGPQSILDGRLTFSCRFYDEQCADVAADVVVCRHVIEHVATPLALLRAVRAALAKAPAARVFFETPCVEWILDNRVIWDFFYEHCSLFTASSLKLAFARAGFAVERVEHRFGGQYLWLEAHPALGPVVAPPPRPQTAAMALEYGRGERALRDRWQARLRGLGESGKVALWGAGAKGATFANLIDPERTLLDCVVDLNPNKQGHAIPGTGHPIVAPAQLPARGVRRAVLMNPNYRDENLRLLADAGIDIDLINWSEP